MRTAKIGPDLRLIHLMLFNWNCINGTIHMVTIYSCPIGFRLILQNGSKLFSTRFISFCRRFVYSVQDCRNLGQNTYRKTRPARSKSMMGKGPLWPSRGFIILDQFGEWRSGSAFIFCSVQNCSLTTGISHSHYRNRKWEAKDYWESILPCICLSLPFRQ